MRSTRNLFVAIFFMVNVPFAWSIECYKESKYLAIQGDEYYSIEDYIKLSSKEKQEFRDLYRDISGEWVGQVVETDCMGSEASPTLRVKDYRASVKIKAGSKNSVTLRMVKKDKNSSRNETLKLFSEDILFGKTISGSRILTQEKYRISNSKTSRLFEKQVAMRVGKNSLTVDISYYVNGYLSMEQRIRLDRK